MSWKDTFLLGLAIFILVLALTLAPFVSKPKKTRAETTAECMDTCYKTLFASCLEHPNDQCLSEYRACMDTCSQCKCSEDQ